MTKNFVLSKALIYIISISLFLITLAGCGIRNGTPQDEFKSSYNTDDLIVDVDNSREAIVYRNGGKDYVKWNKETNRLETTPGIKDWEIKEAMKNNDWPGNIY